VADWDERYRRGEFPDRPSRFLERAIEKVTPGRALDIACGAGRNSLMLAGKGWRVTAVDASRAGLDLAKTRASERNLAIDFVNADLERGEFLIAPEAYDLVVDIRYLQRNLFPQIRRGLRQGGLFVAEIYVSGGELASVSINPAFLLEPGELRSSFDDWKIEFYEEAKEQDDNERERRVAKIFAVRPENSGAAWFESSVTASFKCMT
jgi:SAM-dependent methyltransferase